MGRTTDARTLEVLAVLILLIFQLGTLVQSARVRYTRRGTVAAKVALGESGTAWLSLPRRAQP